MRKIINIAVVLGAVFCLVGVALARTVWLPEYEEKFEGMDSCAAHGMLSEVEKNEKNLTCLNSQFIQWVGICYKNCRCKFEWTKQKCESKIDGVWRVSGRSCDDGTYVYWEDCVNGACDNRVDNNSEYGCKEYWEDCPSKCKIPYPDNCHNREDVRKDKNNGCAEFWEDCETKCKEEISCEPNDCSDYLLTQKPNNAVSVGECMIGCGDYAPRYKIEACEEGYEMNADMTDCVCKDNECAGQCFIRESKDDDSVAEWADDSCSAGCGDNMVSYYKINKCKDLFTAETDGNNCITGCICEPTNCDDYRLSGDADGPTSMVNNAVEYANCTPDCGKTWKYKIEACEEGYEMNADMTDCVCKDNECAGQCFIRESKDDDSVAEWADDSCSAGCGDNMVSYYKINKCKDLFTAETDGNNCITGCICEPTNCDDYRLSGDADGPTSMVNNAVEYANCTPDCGKTWKYKIEACEEGYTLSEDGLRCDPDCDPNDCAEYTVAENEFIENASYDPCTPSCGGDTMYKLKGCNETFIAETDASGNTKACVCPVNATLKDGKCVCPDVSELKDGKCVCPDVSELKDGECVCPDVSELKDGKCECPENATLESGKCVCKDTFIEETDASGNITACKCPAGYEITTDGEKCLTSCAKDIYNNGNCYLSANADEETSDLSGLKNSSCGGVVYVDGTVRLNPNNTAGLSKANWDGKSFNPCEDTGSMVFSSVGAAVVKLQGSMEFNVDFGRPNTQGAIKVDGAKITFNKAISVEDLVINGSNTFYINRTGNDYEQNQIQRLDCSPNAAVDIHLGEGASVEIGDLAGLCDNVQICEDGSCTKVESGGRYGDSM